MGKESLKFDKSGTCYKCGRAVRRLKMTKTWHHNDIDDSFTCGFVKVKRDVEKLKDAKLGESEK